MPLSLTIIEDMAKDKIHDQVKHALIKDGWTITDDPYTIEFEEITVYADFGAEKLLACQRGSTKIVVEAKSFISRSPVSDLEKALGQYNVYQVWLAEIEPDRQLHLAIDETIYRQFFSKKAIQLIIQAYNVKIIVVDLNQEEIMLWTS